MTIRIKPTLLMIILFMLGVLFIQEYFKITIKLPKKENRFQDAFYNNSESQNQTSNDSPTILGYYSIGSSGPAKYTQKSPVSKTPDYLDFNLNEKISSRLRLIKADTGWVSAEQDKPETWTTRTDVTVPDEHAQRILNLKRTCKEALSIRQREQRKANLTEFFYSKDHKFAYCKVPKSGSTFWMKVFMVLNKGENYSSQISQMSRTEIHDRSRVLVTQPSRIVHNNIRTIIVSRNPFSRLYSAYVDKVYLPLFWEQFSRMDNVFILPSYQINGTIEVFKSSNFPLHNRLLKYRDSFLEKGLLKQRTVSQIVTPVCVNNVSFEDFLKFIISEIKAGRPLEPHWAPISHLCHPCRLNTYKIVKQESFVDDVDHALRSVGVNLDNYEWLRQSLKENRSINYVPSVVAVIEKKLKRKAVTNCINVEEVVKRMWKAFQIQGIISDNIQFPENLLSGMSMFNRELVTKVVLDAIAKHPLLDAEKLKQREFYLNRAYKEVSSETITAIQDVYYLDFILFDYSFNTPN